MEKRLPHKIAMTAILVFGSYLASAQGVSVNTSGADPDPSSVLDVSSTTQGMLVPRMTAAQRTAIASPATGLLVYQTNGTTGFYFYDGSSWMSLNSYTNVTTQGNTFNGPNQLIQGNASGRVPLANGGTDADLSATGGTGQYLKQSTAGGAVTVGTIPYTDVTGTPLLNFLPLAGGTMNDGANIAAGTTNGTKIGTATTQKLGFYNATPVVQQSGNIISALGTLGLITAGSIAASDIPTLNQNTTGSAARWTTARQLAGNSVDGTANVPFNNKFIVQGTADAGLTGAQFMGALGTGLVKNTTTTGVQSIAVAGTDYQAPGNYITALTGDVTASGPGSAAATLAASGVSAGTYGSSTVNNVSYPIFTVDGKGRVTSATSNFVPLMITGAFGTAASALPIWYQLGGNGSSVTTGGQTGYQIFTPPVGFVLTNLVVTWSPTAAMTVAPVFTLYDNGVATVFTTSWPSASYALQSINTRTVSATYNVTTSSRLAIMFTNGSATAGQVNYCFYGHW